MIEDQQPKTGEKYQHYKGGIYRIVPHPRYSDDEGKKISIWGFAGELVVWYQSEKDDQIWVRSLREFNEVIVKDSKRTLPRFTKISDVDDK